MKAVVEIDVVGNENRVLHECLELVGNVGKQWRIRNHFCRNTCQPRNAGRYCTLRIEQRLKAIDDLAVSDLHSADLGHAMLLTAPAGRLDINDDVRLVGVEDPAYADDVCAEPGITQLLLTQQLVGSKLIALGFDLDEAHTVIVNNHQVRIAIACSFVIPTNASQHLPGGLRRRMVDECEQRIQY